MKISSSRFLGKLKAHVKDNYGGVASAAAEWEVSYQYVHAVISGEKVAPLWMAAKVGYQPVKKITYTFEEIGADEL